MDIKESFHNKLNQIREGAEHSFGEHGKLVASAINHFGTKDHPAADESNLHLFSNKYVKSVLKKAHKHVTPEYQETLTNLMGSLKEDYDSVAKKEADHADYVAKNLLKGEKKLKNKVTKLSRKLKTKAVTGMDEDYDADSAEATNYSKKTAKWQRDIAKHTSDKKQKRQSLSYARMHDKEAEKYNKKAVTGLDEASDRVVTASKKSEKGTKWKLISRNPDSEGSNMELRQGKRVKMRGGFYRDSQDFGMNPTKRGKMDIKAKGKYYDDPKDIMKTVKESEQIDEISSKLASSYLRGNHKSVTDKKGIKIWKAFKRADGRELAVDKLSGTAKVPTKG